MHKQHAYYNFDFKVMYLSLKWDIVIEGISLKPILHSKIFPEIFHWNTEMYLSNTQPNIDGIVQERCNYFAETLELRLSIRLNPLFAVAPFTNMV